jgi:hypothetical protein
MLHRITKHVRTHLIGYLALFVALGGTSYAAINLPKNSVTGVQVKDHTLTGADIKDGSLLKKNFKSGDLPVGPQGPQGLPGAPGQSGGNGANGVNGVNGADGHTVLTRARGQGAASTSGVTDTAFPLNHATFTQRADQIVIFQGQFSYQSQAACNTGYVVTLPTVSVKVFVDGKMVAFGSALANVSGTADLSFLNLFEPGSDMSRSITAQISDNCVDQDVTVNDVKVNAIGLN